MSDSDIATMNLYLAGLANYMTGATAPAGQEPVPFQYGVYGATIGLTARDTVFPAHARYSDIKVEIANLQRAQRLPAYGPERLFIVFTQGIIFDDLGTASGDHTAFAGGQYVARVPFEQPMLSGKTQTMVRQMSTSHEVLEAATDPFPDSGWVARTAPAKPGGEIGDVCTPAYQDLGFGFVSKVADKLQSQCGVFGRQRLSQTAAVSSSLNRLDIFTLGSHHDLLYKYFDPVLNDWVPSLTTWNSLGGTWTAPPTVVSWGPGRIDVFTRGFEGGCYHRAFDGNQWSADFDYLGGRFIGQLSAVSWASDRLDVVGQGTDGAVWHKAWDGSNWQPSPQGWDLLGGVVVGPPAVASWAPNRLLIMGQALNSDYAYKLWNGTAWAPSQTGWYTLGGSFIGKPVIAVSSSTRMDVIGQSVDGSYRHEYWDGTGWKGNWETLGGIFAGPPAAASSGPNQLDIVGEGMDFAFYYKSRNGASWFPSKTDWQPLGGEFLSGPAVVESKMMDLSPIFFVFGDGTTGTVFANDLSIFGWNQWMDFGGSVQ